jgi:hypothetical protein
MLTGFAQLSVDDEKMARFNLSSPGGPGHLLYLKSELTEARCRIYSDNIAMARWLQSTVLGCYQCRASRPDIAVTDAQFSKSGDAYDFWTERLDTHDEQIVLTRYKPAMTASLNIWHEGRWAASARSTICLARLKQESQPLRSRPSHARRVKPSALQSSLPTPWWTKKRPAGSYFFLTASSFG